MTAPVFWVDGGYDRDNASDGVSRYGAYLRDRLGSFADCLDWDEPQMARFAATAWRIATGPVMAPGYVRCHPRVLRHEVERNEWDGSLVACVDLITGWPQQLTGQRLFRRWRDWPTEYRFMSDQRDYLEPSGRDLTKAPYLLGSASLRFTIPMDTLPEPPADPASLRAALLPVAQEAVVVLVGELNRAVGPALALLEGDGSRD